MKALEESAKEQEKPLDIPLPDLIDGSEYLVAFFHECGVASLSMSDYVSLSWQEIDCWKRVTNTDLTPWEARMIKKMSSAYVAEIREARSPTRVAPYVKVEEVVDRDVVEKSVVKGLSVFKIRKFDKDGNEIKTS